MVSAEAVLLFSREWVGVSIDRLISAVRVKSNVRVGVVRPPVNAVRARVSVNVAAAIAVSVIDAVELCWRHMITKAVSKNASTSK